MLGLSRSQKEAVGLLSVGSFLEYFDLMLYIHMAVLLNELFFPKTEPHTTALLAAFAFWSTYVARPIGALLFGWIGDNIGRKATVIITTMMMVFACITMALVKTYAEIGIIASVIVTICRMLQGMSCTGEIAGAELYLTETIQPPLQYPAVTAVTVFSVLGATAALTVASLVTSSPDSNWRIAFLIGAGVAITGFVARTALKETPDFVNAKYKMKQAIENAGGDLASLNKNPIVQEKVNWKTTLAYFSLRCAWPAGFYFAYIYCGNILKQSFSFTSSQVIHQNFIVSIVELIMACILLGLSYKIYPLKILKFILGVFTIFIICCPWLLENAQSSFHILLIQSFVGTFALGIIPAAPIFYKHFPIFKRFTYTSFLYALSRILMYGVTSFGFVYLIDYFSYWGILFIMIPVIIAYGLALIHFEELEVKSGNYHP